MFNIEMLEDKCFLEMFFVDVEVEFCGIGWDLMLEYFYYFCILVFIFMLDNINLYLN